MKELFRSLIARTLEFQARRLIRRHRPKLVAVAGSLGKTSTKFAIAKVLEAKYRVLIYEKENYNSEISLPLTVFNLPLPPLYNPLAWLKTLTQIERVIRGSYPYDVVMLELSTDHPGELARFMRYLKPDIGVVTAIAPEHMENFADMAAVFEEEFTLARGSQAALLNLDFDELKSAVHQLGDKPVRTYGTAQGDYHWADFSRQADGRWQAELQLGKARILVHTQILARQGLGALAAAAAVGDQLGLGVGEIKLQLEAIRPVAGRMNPLPGKRQSLIIDDSYNAAPDSVIAALDTLYDLQSGRKIAILGNMNELGDFSKPAHNQVGARCGRLDYLVTIGQLARDWIVPAAKRAGLPDKQIRSFASPYQAGQLVASLVHEGDKVLVKGSQNRVFAEEAAKQLLADPTDAAKLVRQSAGWMQQKRSQFGRH